MPWKTQQPSLILSSTKRQCCGVAAAQRSAWRRHRDGLVAQLRHWGRLGGAGGMAQWRQWWHCCSLVLALAGAAIQRSSSGCVCVMCACLRVSSGQLRDRRSCDGALSRCCPAVVPLLSGLSRCCLGCPAVVPLLSRWCPDCPAVVLVLSGLSRRCLAVVPL